VRRKEENEERRKSFVLYKNYQQVGKTFFPLFFYTLPQFKISDKKNAIKVFEWHISFPIVH